ncbi:MAG: CHAP domain-containing protein [Eubacteriales bacterium]|nr:CHAP domain-containing protein [Eubacteriales bacterium]
MILSMLKDKVTNLKSLILTLMVVIVVATTVVPMNVQAEETTEVESEAKDDYTLEGWLSTCQKVGRDLTKYHFRYGSKCLKSLDSAISRKRRCNCAAYVSWCMQEYGILNKGQVIWSKHGRVSKRYSSMSGKVKFININRRPTQARLQAGDIVCWKSITHMCIYAGRNSEGKMMWLDGGSMGLRDGRRKRRYYCSADRMKVCSYLNKFKMGYIIRIKGL